MPNRRSKDQKLINFPARKAFTQELDRGVKESGIGDRSKFIREAIVEKLERIGIKVPKCISAPPGRVGKGGPNRATGEKVQQVSADMEAEGVGGILQKRGSRQRGPQGNGPNPPTPDK